MLPVYKYPFPVASKVFPPETRKGRKKEKKSLGSSRETRENRTYANARNNVACMISQAVGANSRT